MKTTSSFRRLFAAAPVAVSLLLAPALQATPLLTAAYEAQLEAWLGQGDLIFTNVYTKQAGDDDSDFHAAADGKGATFTLMSIFENGGLYGASLLPNQVIGGYNPQSWNSSGTYNETYTDAERTAFLYNLTSGTIQRQNLIGQGAYDIYHNSGQDQTFNSSGYGPTFGSGHDIYIGYNLNGGYARNINYGGTSYGDEIVSGVPNGHINFPQYNDEYSFDVGALEVWTFAPATSTVPDTAGTLGLLSVSLLTLAGFRRRVA